MKNYYTVFIKPSHINWGTYRNPTNRDPIEGESYVPIPSNVAKEFNIVRGNKYIAHFSNGYPSIYIKASGNGSFVENIQYAKQFEGIGEGACKAFTPWYNAENATVGDTVKVEFLSSNELLFTLIKN